MDKIAFDIPKAADGKWGSYISKYKADSGKVQPNMFSINSRNIVTSLSGQAEKRSGGVIWNPNSLLSGAPLDQYEGIFLSGERLLIMNDAGTLKASTGNGLFSDIVGGTGFTNPANFEFATYQNRVYGCDAVDGPIVIDTVTSYGGVSYSATPAKIRGMGAQVPSSAATAVRATDSTTNQVPAGSHTYKITYLYYNGAEESNGSATSAVCVNDSSHTSNSLTAIPAGGYGVTARNIYRDNNDGNFLLLATLSDNTTTSYTDILPVGSTPTPIPTTNGLPPTFKYVALYLDRLFVIDVTGKNIFWSNPGEPDVFNQSANSISGPQDDVMTAIYLYNGIPWVFGQHTVGVILGTTDSSFFYSPISTSVGCIDNRSIQTRTIISTPTLIWLSATPNKGLYYTNGSTVQYLSDLIEDLTFNLAQISFLQRQNTQNSQAAFQGGTASASIDLLTNPGTIQTINPVSSYSHAADWAAGTLSNIAVSGDQLMVPVGKAFTLASGTLGGQAQISGANITLPGAAAPYSLAAPPDGGLKSWTGSSGTIYMPFIPTQTGTLSGYTVYCQTPTVQAGVIGGQLLSDNLGTPGSVISGSNLTSPFLIQQTSTFIHVGGTSTAVLTAGTRYWVGFAAVNSTTMGTSGGFPSPGAGSYFSPDGSSFSPSAFGFAGGVDITPTHTSSTGTWQSPVYDSLSTTLSTGMTINYTGSYPGGSSSSVQVQGSSDQSSWTTTDTLSSMTGTQSLTGGVYRYWRIIVTVSTSDNTNVPLVSAPSLFFNTTGTWTSAAILCTTDITALSALIQSASIPFGTTSTITIATSASSGSGYSSFTAIGLATPNTYAKIRVTMVTTTDNLTSPTLLSAELDWTVTGTLISSVIDTGSVPSGWGLFQYAQVGTAGTVAFSFRTASSSSGLSGASWVAVSNGAFPTNSVLEFCQWKATLTATGNNTPEVNSVTVNWVLTSGTNIRPASLFFNKSYYLAVATAGSTFNNILIEMDYEGNWRIHDGVTIGTMGTYFNDAYYADSTTGKVYSAFALSTDNGTAISFDLRTKAFGAADNIHLKVVRSLKVAGTNTGTTIHAYYSVDLGGTWVEMLNSSGTTGYATTADSSEFTEFFVPTFSGASPTSGRTIIFRVTSTDSFPCAIRQLSPSYYVRKGKGISEAFGS